MSEPISILVDRTETGHFRATSPDEPSLNAEAETIAQLFSVLVLQVEPFFKATDPSVTPGEIEDETGFDSDLNYLLSKNAELYRRLAM